MSRAAGFQLIGDVDKFGYGLGAHFLHDLGAVGFDGALGCTQFDGNFFVHLASHHAVENFEFTRGQGVVTGLPVRQFFARGARFAITGERISDDGQEDFALDGFREKIDGASLDRADSCRNIAMAADENNRERLAALGQRFLQIETARAGHPGIDQDTAGARLKFCQQEVTGVFVAARFVAGRPQETENRELELFVVVHDVDDGSLLALADGGLHRFGLAHQFLELGQALF